MVVKDNKKTNDVQNVMHIW